MSTDYEPNTDLIDDAIEVTEELRQAIKRVADVVMQYNENPNRTKEDTKWLETVVDNFNFDQKYQAVRIKCSTPTELLDQFMQRRVVTQIKVVPHNSNKLYGIEFHTYYLDFQDFYNANKSAFPKYYEFNQILSLFLHNIHEEITNNANHNDFFPYRPYRVIMGKEFRTIENKNPYTAYVPSLEWYNRLNLANVTSAKRINPVFACILTTYFPGFQFEHFTRSTWNYIFMYIGEGHKLESTMDFLLRFAWWRVHKKLGNNDSYYPWQYHPITRHIAWCENEHKRVCLKFGFECHSSVNCPFYRESLIKKQNRKMY